MGVLSASLVIFRMMSRGASFLSESFHEMMLQRETWDEPKQHFKLHSDSIVESSMALN